MTTYKPPLSLHAAITLAASPLGGATNAALSLGWPREKVAHAGNPNRPEMLRLDDAMKLDQMCMDAGGGTPILDHYRAFLAPEDGPKVSFFAHTAAMIRESGSLTGKLVSALEDGRITADERKALAAIVQEFSAMLTGLAIDLGPNQ